MLHRLDTLGLHCPLPVRLTERRIRELEPGAELEVVGDDPALGLDLEAWCWQHGHHVVERTGEPPGPVRFLIRVGPTDEPS